MNNKIDMIEIEDMINCYKDKDKHEKHLKGYSMILLFIVIK